MRDGFSLEGFLGNGTLERTVLADAGLIPGSNFQEDAPRIDTDFAQVLGRLSVVGNSRLGRIVHWLSLASIEAIDCVTNGNFDMPVEIAPKRNLRNRPLASTSTPLISLLG